MNGFCGIPLNTTVLLILFMLLLTFLLMFDPTELLPPFDVTVISTEASSAGMSWMVSTKESIHLESL